MVLNSPKHEEFWLGFLKAYDADFVVAICYAAGLSAFALLKATVAIVKKLADIMLQHDTYETHLDCNDKNHRSY